MFVLKGRVLAHDGKPMRLAHVHIEGRVVEADASGAFTITAGGKGFQLVRFTGVDHDSHTMGVYFDGNELSVEVRLGTYRRLEPAFFEARVVVRVRGKDGAPKVVLRVPLTKQKDGTYGSEIKRRQEELLVSVENVVREGEVNVPEASGFVLVEDRYLGVVTPRGGKSFVRVDPGKLAPPGLHASMTFTDPASRAARIAVLYEGAARRVDEGPAGRAAHAAWRAEIVKALATERDADAAAAMRMAYLAPSSTLDRKSEETVSVARALLDNVPRGAPIWAFRPEAAITAADIAGRKADAELDEIGNNLRLKEIASAFLGARVRAASLAGRDDELGRLLGTMKERFAGTPAADSVAVFAPARKVRPGRELPDFDLALLPEAGSGRGARVSRASIRGKVALIDFWGTWCVPCVKEMPTLHEVFARHKDRGFTIVSVGTREKVASINYFRAHRWKMPWSNVVLDEASLEDIIDRFEVRSYPSPILVDREGKIVAIGDDLRGEGLRRAVDVAMDGR